MSKRDTEEEACSDKVDFYSLTDSGLLRIQFWKLEMGLKVGELLVN